jgi:hypothetical protein
MPAFCISQDGVVGCKKNKLGVLLATIVDSRLELLYLQYLDVMNKRITLLWLCAELTDAR